MKFEWDEAKLRANIEKHGIVLVIVHTETDEVIRIISARKATKYEEKRYFEEIAD